MLSPDEAANLIEAIAARQDRAASPAFPPLRPAREGLHHARRHGCRTAQEVAQEA